MTEDEFTYWLEHDSLQARGRLMHLVFLRLFVIMMYKPILRPTLRYLARKL